MSDGSQAVDDYWELAKKALEESGMTVADLERQANVKLPDDLKTLLGEDLRISVGKSPTSMASQTDLPIAVGFGVRTPEQAAEIAKGAAGVVVGSAFIDIIAQHGDFYLLYSLGGKNQIRSLRIDNIYSVKISREQRLFPKDSASKNT